MRNKALYITLIVLILSLLSSSLPVAASNKVAVNLNGKPLALQVADNPYLDGQIIYATPALIKALGATATSRTVKVADKQGKKVTKYQLVVTKGQTNWVFTVGASTCVKTVGKGKPVLLNTGAMAIISGIQVHVPLVFVAGQLGYTAIYDAKLNVVYINSKPVPKPPVKPQPKQSYKNLDIKYNVPWEFVDAKKRDPNLYVSEGSDLGCQAIQKDGYYEANYRTQTNELFMQMSDYDYPVAKQSISNMLISFCKANPQDTWSEADLKKITDMVQKVWAFAKKTEGKKDMVLTTKIKGRSIKCFITGGFIAVEASRP